MRRHSILISRGGGTFDEGEESCTIGACEGVWEAGVDVFDGTADGVAA